MSTLKLTKKPRSSQESAKTTNIWKSKGSEPADSIKAAPEAKKPQPKQPDVKSKPVYRPKLMIDTDAESKSVLIKIAQRTSVRQVVNTALRYIRDGWAVKMNAYQLDIAKVILAAEIVKTRSPFLHQETAFIQTVLPAKMKQLEAAEDQKEDKSESQKTFTRNGIKIILSREAFPLDSQVGYQKPKPRVFIQPDPKPGKGDDYRKLEVVGHQVIETVEPKGRKSKPAKPQSQPAESKPEKDKDLDRPVTQARNQASKPKNRQSRAAEGHSGDQEFWSEYDPYHPVPFVGRGRRVAYRYPEHDEPMPGVRRGAYPPRQRYPDYLPEEQVYVARRGRGAYKFYKPGPRQDFYDEKQAYDGAEFSRPVYPPREQYGGPQRPGYYAGSRPLGLDQKREPARGKFVDAPSQRKAKPASAVKNQRKGPQASQKQ